MSAPRKFDQELRERAVRMYRDRLEQHEESKLEARRQVGAVLDLNRPRCGTGWRRPSAGRAPGRASRRGRVSPRRSGR